MIKAGSAQYEGQRFLVTSDSGKTWNVTLIPDSTLYSFLRVQGKYWTVGTQVVRKTSRAVAMPCQQPFIQPMGRNDPIDF